MDGGENRVEYATYMRHCAQDGPKRYGLHQGDTLRVASRSAKKYGEVYRRERPYANCAVHNAGSRAITPVQAEICILLTKVPLFAPRGGVRGLRLNLRYRGPAVPAENRLGFSVARPEFCFRVARLEFCFRLLPVVQIRSVLSASLQVDFESASPNLFFKRKRFQFILLG
jgi:hypothetical protein